VTFFIDLESTGADWDLVAASWNFIRFTLERDGAEFFCQYAPRNELILNHGADPNCVTRQQLRIMLF
jgi:hypothetical protein